MQLMGVNINTIVKDNVAIRCDGCLEVIDGTPWRLNILDIVATEVAHSSAEIGLMNPGPFQFHSKPDHVRRWMADNGYFFCRKGEVREIMRPVPIPGLDGAVDGAVDWALDGALDDAADDRRWGLCDGIHRDDHEFIPA